jgi:hypothetical protein
MVIGCSSVNEFWWLFLLMTISGYFINGYWWILIDIILLAIGGYRWLLY